MNIKMIKLMMMGVLAFSFVATPVFAADEADEGEAAEEAPKKARTSEGKGQRPVRMVVAVNKFENKSDIDAQLVEEIRARIRMYVAGTCKFEVMDRESIKHALREQMLAASGDAPRGDKPKAVSYVIYGKILHCGSDRAVGTVQSIGVCIAKTTVELQVSILNPNTGRILAQKSVIGYGVDRQMGTSNNNSVSGQGMRDAIDEACHMAVDVLREVACPARVIKVSKREITIDMTEMEVKEDEVFDIIEVDKSMTDPNTEEVLDYDGCAVGRVQVLRVGRKSSKAKPMDDLKLDCLDMDKHGYFLRRVSKATLKKEAMKRARQGN